MIFCVLFYIPWFSVWGLEIKCLLISTSYLHVFLSSNKVFKLRNLSYMSCVSLWKEFTWSMYPDFVSYQTGKVYKRWNSSYMSCISLNTISSSAVSSPAVRNTKAFRWIRINFCTLQNWQNYKKHKIYKTKYSNI